MVCNYEIVLPQILELARVHGHGAFPTGEISWGADEVPLEGASSAEHVLLRLNRSKKLLDWRKCQTEDPIKIR